MVLAAAWGNAQDWGNIAVISDTMGNNAGRLCIGEGLRVSDIGCPSYAPSVSTAGHVSITGNVSANKFIGDGSLLTGISTASGDRIVSGTAPFTQMIAISDTRYISITQGGSNTGWFDPTLGLVTLGVNATGGISGTTGYFSSPVGINTAATSYMLTVNGATGFYPLGMSAAPSLIIQGDTYQGVSNVIRFRQGTAAGGGMAFTFFEEPYPPLFMKRNAPSSISVGIGTATPTATLDVRGTVSASDAIQVGQSNLICATGISGSIRYNITSDTLQICTASGWKSLVSGTTGGGTVTGTGSATAVAYWSGTSGLTYDNDGFYWDATNNRLGIGTNVPDWSLHISTTYPIVKLDRAASGSSNGGVFWAENGSNRWSMVSYNSNFAQTDRRNSLVINQLGDQSGTSMLVSRFSINDSGNVGINTASQTATLQVSGSLIVSVTGQTSSPTFYAGTNGRVGIGLSAPNTSLEVRTEQGANFGNIYLSEAGGNGRLMLGSDVTNRSYIATMNNVPLVLGIGSAATGPSMANPAVIVMKSNGVVGVGTHSPTATLDVAGTISASNAIQVGTSSLTCDAGIPGALRYNSGNLQYCNGSSWTTLGAGGAPAGNTGDIQFNSGGSLAADTGQFHWDASNNRLGIGTGSPSYPLDVNGVVQASSFFQSSDARLKTNIVQLRWGLAVIEKLRPVAFDWIADKRHAVGLIAQEVSSVIPTAVSANISGTLSVDYSQIIPYLVKGMQELSSTNDKLEREMRELKDTNDKQERRLKLLEERLGARLN